MLTKPFTSLNQLPRFHLISNDITAGQELPTTQLAARLGGQDLSPHLAWHGFPENTKSFVVTVLDPDAPALGGFWHWIVFNIPSNITQLEQGVDDNNLPPTSILLPNSSKTTKFVGAAPPVGGGRHRYFFTVQALDIEKLDVSADTSPANLISSTLPHTIAWASITAWYGPIV